MIVICHLDSKKECENFDYTTTGETTDEESEVELPKRKPKKIIIIIIIIQDL